MAGVTETQKPFACAKEGCQMAFTNEDHLNVHKKKHDMALHLGIDNQSNSVVADQTPTPTRFIRNCEEVGLFQDLQNVNPFDETFRKATELAKSGSLHIPEVSSDDTLHTPHIFPHIEEENNISKFSRNNSNEPEFAVTTIDDALLKLTNKDSDTDESATHVVDCSSKNDADIEVLSLSDGSSDSEQLERNTFLTRSDDNLIITRHSLNNNSAANSIPVSSSLQTTDVPPVVQSSFKESGTIQKEETIKTKLKEALKNRVKTEAESEDCDTMLIQRVEDMPAVSAAKSQVTDSQARVIVKHSTEYSSPGKQFSNVRQILIEDGPQRKNMNLSKRTKLLLPNQLARQREINRAAQVRSRQKKKCWISQMETEIGLLKEEKKELWMENQNLKNEIIWLKTMLLYHKDCPVTRDPQIMQEINLLVKTSQEELQKKMQKNPITSKRVVPIRPNPTSVIAVTSLPAPVLLQVPTQLDPTKHAFQITTLPELQAKPSTPTAVMPNPVASVGCMPKLLPGVVSLTTQTALKHNLPNAVNISSDLKSSLVLEFPSNASSSLAGFNSSKARNKVTKAKEKLNLDHKKEKKLLDIRVNPAHIIHLPNTILPDDFFILQKQGEVQTHPNLSKTS